MTKRISSSLIAFVVSLIASGCSSNDSDPSEPPKDPTCVTHYACDNASLTVCTDSSTDQESGPISCDGSLYQGAPCTHGSDIIVGCEVSLEPSGCAILWYYQPLSFSDARERCAEIHGTLVHA